MKFRVLANQIMAAAFALCLISSAAAQEKQDKNEQQDQQQPALKIGTALVVVPVIVTDRYGRFITGLSRSNFGVLENGTPQKIEDFSSIESPFSVALLIDTSRSTQNKLGAIRKAAQAFIKQLQPRDRVMIVTFDEKVKFISDFTNNPVDLDRAVKSVKSSYLTSLYDAIYLTITEKMDRIQGRKAIVVLTDGVDTASKRASFESALDLVARSGIISYTIQYETRNDGGPVTRPLFFPNGSASGFTSNFAGGSARWQDKGRTPEHPRGETGQKEKGQSIINIPRPTTSSLGSDPPASPQGAKPSSSVNSQTYQPMRDRYLIAADFLRTLAVQSGALYIRAENIENTSYAFQRIAEELRHQYTLTYMSTNEQKDGTYREIAVNVNSRDLIVRARLGYRAPKTDPAESEQEKKP